MEHLTAIAIASDLYFSSMYGSSCTLMQRSCPNYLIAILFFFSEFISVNKITLLEDKKTESPWRNLISKNLVPFVSKKRITKSPKF